MQTATSIAYIKKTRALFLALIQDLSIEQLNEIPPGFNNNIIWNVGHIAVSTLGLCYIRSQVKPEMVLPFSGSYVKGSRPGHQVTTEELDQLKHILIQSIDQIEKDIQNETFTNWVTFNTDTYQIPMDNIENTLTGCVAHENLHLGIAKAMKSMILKKDT